MICEHCGTLSEDCECEVDPTEINEEFISDDLGETDYDGDCA